jgi:hypothetical protein
MPYDPTVMDDFGSARPRNPNAMPFNQAFAQMQNMGGQQGGNMGVPMPNNLPPMTGPLGGGGNPNNPQMGNPYGPAGNNDPVVTSPYERYEFNGGATNPNAMPFGQTFGQMQNMGNQQVNAQNPSFQAQNSGTAQAQAATQPPMNTGNASQFDNKFITGAYQQMFGRAPDQAGYDFWTKSLASGSTPEQVIQSMQTSPEYQQAQALKTIGTATGNNPFGLSGVNAAGNQTSTNPYIQAAQQTAVGNYQGATAATAANRVNQQTPYSSLQYQQTGTDASGNPIWSANQALNPTLQTAMSGLQNRLASTAGQGINTNTLAQTGINPGEMYSDAIMRRLQPQLQQQQASVETRLANQGIMPGSEAYNRAKTQLAQQQNDLLTSAQVGGIDVGLRANQQGFNQQLQQSNLPIQQLGAFNQATQPGYVTPYNQAAVAGPDYLGSYTTGQAAQIAAQNAANAKTANLQSGLFGLGSSAILGGGGVRNLARDIGGGLVSGGNWLDNLVTRNANQALPDFVGPIF